MVIDLEHVICEQLAKAELLVVVRLRLQLLGRGQAHSQLRRLELLTQILVMLDRLRGMCVLCVDRGADLEVGRDIALLLLLLCRLQRLIAAQPDRLLDEADQAMLIAEYILQT